MTNEGDGLPEVIYTEVGSIEDGNLVPGRFCAREFRFVVGLEVSDVYVFIDADKNCPTDVQGWHFKRFPTNKPFIEIYNEMLSSDSPLLWPQRNPEPVALTFFERERIKI